MTEPQLAGLAPRAALRAVRAQLEAAGVPDADFDARELYRLATGRDPRLDAAPLPAAAAARLAALTARRCAREPLQYIAGQWDFLDFTLAVGPGAPTARSSARPRSSFCAPPPGRTRPFSTSARAPAAWGSASSAFTPARA